MCEYITKKELKEPKQVILNWITKVQKEMKKEHKITFSYIAIGSSKRNMVIKLCNKDLYDLDYQIVLQKTPKDFDVNKKAKKIKDLFRTTFDKYRPSEFSCCEDSTQALTTKNIEKKYGYDIIITRYDENSDFYILRNNKNRNNANTNDYQWAIKSDMKNHHENFKKIKGPEMFNYLRKIYKEKRHKHKDDNERKAYQLFNEAVNETLTHFNK